MAASEAKMTSVFNDDKDTKITEKFIFEDLNNRLKITEVETKNAKIMQAILEWFESWQLWQRKILITGIVNRFHYSQLRGLLMAVESVFHKDFATTVRKIYPVPQGVIEVKESKKKIQPQNTKRKKIPRTKDKKKVEKVIVEQTTEKITTNVLDISDEKVEENMRMRSPVGSRNRTTSGSELPTEESHVLSPIVEGETAPAELEDLTVLPDDRPTTPTLINENEYEQTHGDIPGVINQSTSFLITRLMNESPNLSQVSTLVSSLSPIEETSPESTESGGSEASFQIFPLTYEEGGVQLKEPAEPKITVKSEKIQIIQLKKKKAAKKNIPEAVMKRIASNSSTTSSSKNFLNICLTPIGIESEVTLDFKNSLSSDEVNSNDFFNKINNNDVLGQLVTTKSKIEPAYMENYDFTRNRAPVPTMQQMYKNKKFWGRETVRTNAGRLKELFREQLKQIWQWIDLWPAHKRSRLMIELFSRSSGKIIQYAAECLKAKVKETYNTLPPIDLLTDDLLLKIFEKLDLNDLLQASYVCQRWYAVLNSDVLWKDKCNEIGLVYGISNLSDLLASGAEENQSLDWKQAFTEVNEYLTLNMELESTKNEEVKEKDEESSENESEIEEKFADYIPYWKVHPPGQEHKQKNQTTKISVPVPVLEVEEDVKEVIVRGKKGVKKDTESKKIVSEPKSAESIVIEETNEPAPQKGGFLQMWRNITEDIKEDTNLDDAQSHSCEEVDMFADMQTWEDVGLLTNIGQRFAVDLKIEDAIKACSRNWPIAEHLLSVAKVQVFKGHQGSVNVVKSQGSRILTGGSDRCVRVWDKHGECFAKIEALFRGGINDISIGSIDCGNVMYTASWDMCVRAWSTLNFKLKATMSGHKGSVTRVAADKKFIISCSHDSTIKVWDRKNFKCEKTINCHQGAVECMIYHKRMIFTGGVDKMIYVNNSHTGELVRSYSGHQSPVTVIKKQHDLLASGDRQGMIYFWSIAIDKPEHVDKIQAHESQINAICMHGPTFFSASKDALIKEWDLVTLITVRIFQGHTDSITDVLWTEKYLLTASKDNDLRIWWWAGNDDTSPESIKMG